MIHRYLATMVGALLTLLMGLAWYVRRASIKQADTAFVLSPWWATWTFIWVCVQGLFGALTVTLKLYPLVVTAHLLGGLLGVSLLAAQVSQLMVQRMSGFWRPVPPSLRTALLVFWFLWLLQSGLGAWVSTNGAVLVCADVPTCQGQWWPPMDWQQGFTLLRHLGSDGQGGAISVAALTAIHMAHRLGAVLVTVICLYLLLRLWRANSRTAASILLAVLIWQIMAGLSNVVLDWPLLAALAHTLGAALMATCLMLLAFPSRSLRLNHV